jgi:hypothetical protein
MMSAEQFNAMMATMQELARAMALQAAASTPTGGQREGGHVKRTIETKAFNRLAKFAKGEEQWKEYNFEFQVILGSESPDMRNTLKVIEDQAKELSTEEVCLLDPERAERIKLEKLSKELYEVLVITTDGEAKLMVRNTPDNDGILAWHRLYRHYNRRTFARILRIHKEAMHPKPVRDLGKLISTVVEWEDRWNAMAKEHKGTLPVIWKMAALMELCPVEVQDMIYQNVDDVNEDYDKLKQKIITWTSNKISNDGVPMDIGKIGFHQDQWQEEYEIDAVNTQCYACGGWGHTSRECPSRHGKGGDKGKGKGNFNGKGGGKDSGKGGKDGGKGKSSGKGYQGTCFTCGKTGHKAWECRSGARRVGAVDEEDADDDDDHDKTPDKTVATGHVEINTVWSVGAVEVKRGLITNNRFKELAADNETQNDDDNNDDNETPNDADNDVDHDHVDHIHDDRITEWTEVHRHRHGGHTQMGRDSGKHDDDTTTTTTIDINAMDVDKEVRTKAITITLDSGAGASCWPERLLKGVPMKPRDKGVKFRAANGTELKYHGTKVVKFKVGESGDVGELRFHVTDTTKPLASAAAIVKLGNRVVLDGGSGNAFIENVRTGRRIALRESGGTFVFDADCFTGPLFSGRE